MTLPVSNYQELLIQVRELTHETIRLQRQLSSDLFDNADPPDVNHNFSLGQKNYENGKHLTDNVIRQFEKNRKNETGQNPLAEYNNFRYRPRFCQNLESTEGIRAGELTSRLLTWRNRSHRPTTLQEDAEECQKRAERFSDECRVSRGSVIGVSVEGAGSWRAQRRPHDIELPTPLSSVAAHELESSVDGAAFNPVVATATTSARCPLLKTPSSSSNSLPVNANFRPTLYLGTVIAETSKEDAMEPEVKEEDERRSSTPSPEIYSRRNKRYNEGGSSEEDNKPDTSLQGHRLPSSYRGTWPIRRDVWANQQMGFSPQQSTSTTVHNDVASVMSFSSNSGTALGCSTEMQGDRRLGAKVDVVYNLLGMLGSTEGREDMSATLLSMSNSIDNCLIMRQSGCLPLLVQLIHAPGQDPETREKASRALHNIVHAKSDERAGRREARVLRFLEQLRDYCQALRTSLETGQVPDDLERHPGPTIAALMKLSFDEAHRHAMCQLGGLHAVAELIEMDHMAHGSECDDQNCITLRRYAGMALTNLTFGDGNNKALLCSFREFMKALVSQLRSPSDDLRQVTASVLRNLSWRADSSSKQTLREVGAVTGLMKAAMEGRKESTLKSILSALWNLSAHCSTNKVDICAVDGALAFLVDMLSYKAPSKTLAIVENAGGILRNVSSHIAVREDYRSIVRERGCLQVLLQQLRSPSLTVVSNACGALWNLSARCPQDQRLLWDLGAVPMLRSLIHSKHKMISMGSSAALKNLLSARPGCNNLVHLDSTARGLGLPTLPTLVARRQRALEQEIDQNLAETCDNIEPSTSPTNKDDKFSLKVDHSFLGINARALRPYQLHNQPSTSSIKCNGVARSESRDSMRSVTSTHSDTMFERVNRHVLNGLSPTEIQIKQQSSSLHAAVGFESGMSSEGHSKVSSEKKYTLRYKNAIPDRLKSSDGFNGLGDLRCTNSTISWSSAPDQESACSQNLLHSSVEDNLPQSISLKAGSQSSIPDETELNVCTKSEYSTAKMTMDSSSTLSFVGSSSSVKDGFGNVYEKTLHQHNSLNTIQKAISPTVSHRTEGTLFTDYAVTDLDQPTDYSLRYAERSLEDEEKQHSHYFRNTEQELIHEDTLKTYYTEGTPHGMSLNCSRAASASDLQDDRQKKLQERNKDKETLKFQNTVKKVGKGSQGMHYFEAAKDSNVEVDDHSPTVNAVSLKTTLSQVSSSNLQYDDDKYKASNSTTTKSVAEEKYETKNVIFEKNEKCDQNYPANGVNSYVTSTLKASNDSGYQVSDGDEDDEDLLTACINIGMQNNRHRHSFIGNNFEKVPRNESTLTRYQTSIALDQMECNSSVDSTMNSLDMKQESEETTDDVSKNKMMENSPNVNIGSDYSQNTSKFMQKTEENKIMKQSNQISQNELGKASLVMDDDNLCNFSLPSNLRNTPELQETIVFNSEPNQQQYLSSIDNQSNEDISSLVHNDLLEDTTNWENEKPETSKDKVPENLSMQQSYTKVTDSESSESIDSVEQSEHALLELCIQSGPTKIDDIQNISLKSNTDEFRQRRINDLDEDKMYNDTCEVDGIKKEETSTKHKTQKGGDATKHVEKEEVYRRQRDPDAMIASLDRLTATLVQQTEAIRERDSSAMKQSILSDTWNEDSPNEISFPSISISAPIIASFKSDVPEDQGTETVSSESGHMTNSKIIQREAIKLAEAVDAEMNRQNELDTTSMTSMDLEAIKPPSSMGSLLSLTASYAGSGDCSESFSNRDRCNSTSLPPLQVKSVSTTDSRGCRKKSLPLGVVAKRALNQTQSHTGSLENLLNECTGSHLESVKPPSMMDELPDVGDMENSMLSVASITSEIAETKDHYSHSLTGSDAMFDLLKPVANVLSITCMRYAEAMQNSANNSLSECLENINPPSLFNEVCEMDESTMEQATETNCSDTLCIDAELYTEEAPPHPIVERIDEVGNDTDEAVTPISSEYCGTSSAESTPRKRSHRNLTPKQKRNLAKERYKTYTIAAEMDKKEKEAEKRENANGEEKVTRGKCSPFSKLTPKQRRQEDRARFQTQVLENPFPDLNQDQNVQREVDNASNQETAEKPETSPVKSSIPMLSKVPGCKTMIKNRIEQKKNRERYRTRTLNDSECIFKDAENGVASNTLEERVTDTTRNIQSDEIQTMLEQNATIVLNTLNESKAIENIEDTFLDCETLSLVSNESESERNLRMKFVNGVSKKLIGTCAQQMENVHEPEGDHREAEAGTPRSTEDVRFLDAAESESDDESNNTEEPPRETKRPRIIKPGMVRDASNDSNATDKSDPESPKAIRGRRKALYSNPITRKPTPQSSPLKQVNPVSGIPIGRSNTSPIVRATRATTLRQNNNNPNIITKDTPKSNTNPKITPGSTDAEKRTKVLSVAAKRASVPQKGSSLTFTKSVKRHSTPPTCSPSNYQEAKTDVPIKPLERQGTFTKDEPEVENAPTVVSTSSSPIKTKIAKPIRGATSKVHPAVSKPKVAPKTHQAHQSKVTKGTTSEKMQSKALPLLVAPKRLPTGKVSATSKIPGSQNVTQMENGKIFRKVSPLGQRSNSNSSIVSNSSTGAQTRKLAKEATSKIASLWKKVEESKSKQRFEKPDTRQWVQPGNCANGVDGPSPVSNPPAFRLFRSSTFEGVPQENDHPESTLYKSKLKRPLVIGVQPSKAKYRNSCDLSGMNANDAPCKIPVKSSEPATYKKDTVEVEDASVILRKPQHAESSTADAVDPTKRISRLGSFIRVDSAEGAAQTHVNGGNVRTPASAIVPPFNYNPKQDIPSSQATKVTSEESEGKFRMTDCHSDIVTASTRVTTV
nr:PREDICTED: adenomatous polyposis coli homolog isoform X1 [Megachile rotundata]XP_012137621.1 PREDICTED: adenomatous polyposis coli homolog isoform X1 [Megachile rotundata]XP_012137622.1 PREDICTED: adenomatous polyposis coli homolog isoform X1 [Megachile rotundata]XP_012137623.1 PREDICTED: adenomatous polyposis coli homolog isoform X1 [Megachile rotundata]